MSGEFTTHVNSNYTIIVNSEFVRVCVYLYLFSRRWGMSWNSPRSIQVVLQNKHPNVMKNIKTNDAGRLLQDSPRNDLSSGRPFS